ncbi:DUF3558 family protein [Pseudonocardia alni]|uniref:DUF3558 family protein n=1 Tax=Pseudonocardia alni TaxID=33907 RepID=UPI00331D44E6
MPAPTARRLLLGSAAVALAFAIVSCTAEPTSRAPESPLPARPASIEREGLQPCDLIDDAQRRAFDIDEGTARDLTVRRDRAPTCIYLGRSVKIDSNVQLLPVPASELARIPGAVLDAMDGYGTVENRASSDVLPGCDISVDVNDSWSLRVQSQAPPRHLRAASLTEQSLCDRSSELAVVVLSRLTGR